jgi:hypothetical protein
MLSFVFPFCWKGKARHQFTARHAAAPIVLLRDRQAPPAVLGRLGSIGPALDVSF